MKRANLMPNPSIDMWHDGTPVVIDPLGPATPETRAEVKSARRAEQRKATKELVTAYLVMALVAAAFALGSLVGNVTDSDFRDIDIHLPFTPEPSGERAEPEESAR
ncbi:MAG TPA: hypothetical protein VJL80_14485 [Aeromicrobium sp.]|nr:hypothetical protein [Aeromicrobium sp.]HKY59241.1 hypothetical protein [Aeromicrobium sp.]